MKGRSALPVALPQDQLINGLPRWALAAASAAALWLLLMALRRVLVSRLEARCAAPGEHHLAPVSLGVVRASSAAILLLLAAYVGAHWLLLPPAVAEWAGRAALFALLLQGALWGSALIVGWLQEYEASRLQKDAAAVTTMHGVGFVLRLALYALLILIALDNLPGVEVTTLLASLGIGGIAVALALQNVLSDLFASLSIALDKPFVIGDFVAFDGLLGSVQHIGLKTTRLRSLTGEQLVIGNGDLLKRVISNYKRMEQRRIAFRIGVTYETPHEKLVRIPAMLREIVEAQESVRFDRAHFREFGDFSLIFEVVYFVLLPDFGVYVDVQQAINLAIYARFERESIAFAYPTSKVLVAQAE
jgi:small-conductance mechanosensitive channel